MPSFLISTLARQRTRMPGGLLDDATALVSLTEVLDAIPDPRRCPGRRYRLGPLLVLCLMAVLAGAADWAGDHTLHRRPRPRSINGFAKDPLHEGLESSGTRRIRGIAAQTILLAFQLGHANRRKLATWAHAVAMGGNRPRRRPTRQRETKPLGTWTPKGYVNP